MPFERVTLNDGNRLPAIAFGTGSALARRPVTEYVKQALEAGFIHIDSAAIYANEDSVRAAIHETGVARSDLFLTTKYSGGDIQESVRKSLSTLGVDQLDLYLIHHPMFVNNGDLGSAWKELEKIKDEGLSKSIGVSNFNAEQLQGVLEIARIKPAVNQIRLHPYNYAQQKGLLELASKHGIVIEAYSSLTPITKTPGGPVDAPIVAAGERLGVTPTQVILAWVRSKGAVVVTTSSNKKRLQEYLAATDLPTLNEAEIAAIDNAGARGPAEHKFTDFLKPGQTIIPGVGYS